MSEVQKTYKKQQKVICPMIFIPQEQVHLAIGYSTDWAKKMEREDPQFPRRRVMPNSYTKGWLVRELKEYFEGLPPAIAEEKASHA